MSTNTESSERPITETPLEVLERRRQDSFDPSNDEDGCVLYLVGDGGGTATAAVSGGLNELASRGLMRYFDGFGAISGASGAMACAVLGETEQAQEIYTRRISDSDFVSLKRFFRGGPLADLSVIGDIIRSTGIKACDLPVEQPLLVGLSEISDTSVLPTTAVAQTTGEHFTDTLLLSMHMPWFCGPPKGNIIDGGIGWTSTARMAAQDGTSRDRPVTHVLGMAATPVPECVPNDRIGGFTRRYIAKHFGSLAARSLEQFPFVQAQHLNYEVNRGSMEVDGRRVAVQMLRPIVIRNFAGVLTTNPECLQATYNAGQQGVVNSLNGLPHEYKTQTRRPHEIKAERIMQMIALGTLPSLINVRQLLPRSI